MKNKRKRLGIAVVLVLSIAAAVFVVRPVRDYHVINEKGISINRVSIVAGTNTTIFFPSKTKWALSRVRAGLPIPLPKPTVYSTGIMRDMRAMNPAFTNLLFPIKLTRQIDWRDILVLVEWEGTSNKPVAEIEKATKMFTRNWIGLVDRQERPDELFWDHGDSRGLAVFNWAIFTEEQIRTNKFVFKTTGGSAEVEFKPD